MEYPTSTHSISDHRFLGGFLIELGQRPCILSLTSEIGHFSSIVTSYGILFFKVNVGVQSLRYAAVCTHCPNSWVGNLQLAMIMQASWIGMVVSFCLSIVSWGIRFSDFMLDAVMCKFLQISERWIPSMVSVYIMTFFLSLCFMRACCQVCFYLESILKLNPISKLRLISSGLILTSDPHPLCSGYPGMLVQAAI